MDELRPKTSGELIQERNRYKTALRLMSVDLAHLIEVSDPQVTYLEYLNRADKNEPWPYGLWIDE